MKTEKRFIPSDVCPVEVETRNDKDAKIVGLASVYFDGSESTEFRLFDNVVERILPGAFDRALADGDDVVALYNHNENFVLGRTPNTLELNSTEQGLEYRIDPPDTQYAKDLQTSISRGDIRGSSFAFQVEEQDWIEEDDKIVREVRSVRLSDVSPVTRPAYSATSTGLRSLDDCSEAKQAYDAWREQVDTQRRLARAAQLKEELL